MAGINPGYFHGSLSTEDVQAVVAKALGPNVKIVNYHSKPYCEIILGFLGAHSLLEVTVQIDNTTLSEIHSFFVKYIPHNSEKGAKLLKEFDVFKFETTFFRDLVPELLKNFKSEQWSPECYLVKDDVLVFENLKMKNFRVCDLILDEAAVKAAASTVARFHAASVVAEKRLKKSFHEMHPTIFLNWQYNPDNVYFKYVLVGIDAIIGVAETLNLDASKVRDYIILKLSEIAKPSSTRRNILCHTDLWSNNIMINDIDDSPKCILVDFQTLKYVPPAADLAHLIISTMSRKSRDALEKGIIQWYHEVFKETIMRNEPDMAVRSVQDLLEEYEEYRHYALSHAALQHLHVSMDKDFIAKLYEDSVAYEKFFFEEKTGTVIEMMEKNPDYREKITELVKEVVECANRIMYWQTMTGCIFDDN
ncbi:hypothetical protein TSAR_008588 [Trichomalopsis sarcophagae]|uniref:CHK kinase-like domain-containing protein n=1 Tax=Trichomalopsis sarcophagae TaxID=543379 RepID=A0A232ERT3_9HYME|nr:hypothetical protein TSAR_008588 [Trichomalopsis sarcophagae]